MQTGTAQKIMRVELMWMAQPAEGPGMGSWEAQVVARMTLGPSQGRVPFANGAGGWVVTGSRTSRDQGAQRQRPRG